MGLKVKCPNCKKMLFETTDKYNPDVSPNGSMVKSLLPYHIDWLCASTTLAAEMTCPECTCLLAPYGRLTVVEEETKERPVPTPDEPITTPFTSDGNPTPAPVEEVAPEVKPEAPNPLICDVCGKKCKNQLGLNSHKRSHKK